MLDCFPLCLAFVSLVFVGVWIVVQCWPTWFVVPFSKTDMAKRRQRCLSNEMFETAIYVVNVVCRSRLAWGTLCISIWIFQQIFVAQKLDNFSSTFLRDFTVFTPFFQVMFVWGLWASSLGQYSLVTSKWKFQNGRSVSAVIGIT